MEHVGLVGPMHGYDGLCGPCGMWVKISNVKILNPYIIPNLISSKPNICPISDSLQIPIQLLLETH